jgi:hypothetical protein
LHKANEASIFQNLSRSPGIDVGELRDVLCRRAIEPRHSIEHVKQRVDFYRLETDDWLCGPLWCSFYHWMSIIINPSNRRCTKKATVSII